MSFSVINVVRNVSRHALPSFSPVSMRSLLSKPVTRSLWYMSNPSNQFVPTKLSPAFKHTPLSPSCPCGGCRGIHTRGDKELIEFLSEEIAAEKKGMSKTRPVANLDGFDVKHNGSEIVLSKKFNDEQIEIILNVNHSVDADISDEIDNKADNPPQAEMKSKPHFEVKLIKGNQVTRFACSYIQDAGEPVEDAPNDIFTIDELAVFEGKHNDQTYAVAGDILDGYMYDLLMNLLEERGVSNEFADKLSDLATQREHLLFINLLESLQSFVQGK